VPSAAPPLSATGASLLPPRTRRVPAAAARVPAPCVRRLCLSNRLITAPGGSVPRQPAQRAHNDDPLRCAAPAAGAQSTLQRSSAALG
jgi:hypothetical protein